MRIESFEVFSVFYLCDSQHLRAELFFFALAVWFFFRPPFLMMTFNLILPTGLAISASTVRAISLLSLFFYETRAGTHV